MEQTRSLRQQHLPRLANLSPMTLESESRRRIGNGDLWHDPARMEPWKLTVVGTE